MEDLPVGAHQAVPARVTQDARALLAVAAGHVLAIGLALVEGDGIVGHDRCHLASLGLEVEAAIQERDQVRIEVVAREDVVSANGEVVVAAALGGAGAAVVLEHGDDGIAAPALVVRRGIVSPR